LGGWTDQQVHDAMVKGVRKDGTRMLPVMPYEKYSGMAREDMSALIAYMRTLKPVKKATPALKTWAPFARSLGTPLFLQVFGRFSVAPAQAGRSRRALRRLPHAEKFHRRAQSIPLLAGASEKNGPLGEAVPNITPDKETGIGDWRRQDIADLLLTGIKPDSDNVQGLMNEVIQGTPHGYKDMKKEDALAIADYIKSVPAIKNKVK
jgi:hypothetical protein